jgi:RpiR family carbohydrate utilization transcriptional regulator
MQHGHSLIDAMREVLPTLSKSQQRVAQAVLRDIESATRMSIKSLAELAEVSEPTIVRFSRRLGSDGFGAFKLRLSQDFATGRMFLMSETPRLGLDAATVAAQVYEATAQALAYGFAQRDPAALGVAAEAIHAAPRVFCMGVGGSSANVAAEAANRLFRFDVNASTVVDPYTQVLAAALTEPGDALLIFSVTGKPASLLSSATVAVRRGAVVVAITRPDSPLAKIATTLIGLTIPDHDQRFEIPNRSRYAQLYIVDCLATLIAGRRFSTSAQKLEAARQALLELHGPTVQQPIGD